MTRGASQSQPGRPRGNGEGGEQGNTERPAHRRLGLRHQWPLRCRVGVPWPWPWQSVQLRVERATGLEAQARDRADQGAQLLQAILFLLLSHVSVEGPVAPRGLVSALAIAQRTGRQICQVLDVVALCIDPQTRDDHVRANLLLALLLLLLLHVPCEDQAVPDHPVTTNALAHRSALRGIPGGRSTCRGHHLSLFLQWRPCGLRVRLPRLPNMRMDEGPSQVLKRAWLGDRDGN
mmetsp:Transcript_22481/g.57461  ORF Transcript_22481/g.57461 Transcript_22481/m.57461 type:complete len:234 (-) Transcript_22481:326-1027(-)